MEEGSLKRLNSTNSAKTMRQSVRRRGMLNNFTTIILVLIGSAGFCVQSKLTIVKECGELVCKPHNYCSQVDHSCRPCQIACDPELGNYDQGVCEKDCQDYLHDLWYMRKPENESEGFRDELYFDLYYKVQQDLRLLKILIGVVIILSTVVVLALIGIMLYFKRLRNKFQLQQSINSPHAKTKKIADYPVIYSNSKVLSLPIPDIHKGPPSSQSSINNNLSRGSSPDLVSRTVTTQASSGYNNSVFYPTTTTPTNMNKENHSSSLGLRGGSGGFVMENPGINRGIILTPPNLKDKQQQQSRLRKEPSESTLPEYQGYDNPALVPSPVHNVHM